MNSTVKTILRSLIPPGLLRLTRRDAYRGNYSSWQEAVAASEGYNADAIFEKVRNAALQVRNGTAVYERDSVLFSEIQYSWPVLAALLWISARSGNRLNILDFGGSLGSSYYQNRGFLSHLGSLQWSIVEQEKFVRCGKADFEDNALRFYYAVDECVDARHPNTVLFSSVLPYLENPSQALRDVLSHKPEFVIIDRTPFLEGAKDLLTVQKVAREIYGGSYPAWILSERKFEELVRTDYTILARFSALAGRIDVGNAVAYDKGMILVRKTEA